MKKFRSQPVDWDQIARFLASAEKKLEAAQKMRGADEETSYELAYESMLKASLGLLLAHGLRLRKVPGHHVAVIEFAQQHLGAQCKGLVAMFDRMRRKRHQAMYEVTGLITRHEADQAVATAERYVSVIQEELRRRSPQGTLFP